MEDFVQQVSSGSAFYLLYGEAGVGKSRLLAELKQRRLADRNVCFLDLADGDHDDLQKVVEDAGKHAIVIIDHFERATNNARHMLFRAWMVHALDQQMNFIVACRRDYFDEFRQLSGQYHVDVQGFQLLPLTEKERQAFLAFYLFDGNPLTTVSIETSLRKPLKQTRGVIGRLVELADRETARFHAGDPRGHSVIEPLKARVLLALLIIFGAVGVGIWFSGNWSGSPLVEVGVQPIIEPEPPQSADTGPGPGAVSTEETEAEPGMTEVENAPIVTMETMRPAPDDTDSRANDPAAEGFSPLAQPTENPESEAIDRRQDRDSESVQVESTAAGTDPSLTAQAVSPDAFEAVLQATMEWLQSNDGSMGTIQIMSIGFNRFNASQYFRYLDSLADRGVDVSRVRVFATRAGSSDVYTMIYGQYADLHVANRSIADLPEALRANAPIPRTLAGILDEIARHRR